MQKKQKIYHTFTCEELDNFDKQIWYVKHMGNIDEIHEFVKDHIHEHPMASWELIPMLCYM